MAETTTTAELLNVAVDAILESGTFFETDPRFIHFGDEVLIATPSTIILGKADVNEGTMRTFRYENVTVAGEFILERRYAITEQGWADTPEVTLHVAKDAKFWERARW